MVVAGQVDSGGGNSGLRRQTCHLLVLFGFAIAQPIYDLLGRYPEFLSAHGCGIGDLLLLVLCLSLLFPVLLGVGLGALGRWSHRFRSISYQVLLAMLVGAFALQFHRLVSAVPGVLWVFVAGLVACVASLVYQRLPTLRLVLDWLLITVPLFPLLFLLRLPIAQLVQADVPEQQWDVPATAPIVMVVFDEFPLISLLNEKWEIDAERFPHFGRLAAESYWFTQATTVSDWTPISIPSLLSGRLPTPGREALPTLGGHPQNLFTLLAGSYQLRVFENITQLAPLEGRTEREPLRWALFSDIAYLYAHLLLPPELSAHLPPVTESWRRFGRLASGPLPSDAVPQDWTAPPGDWSERAVKFRDFVATIGWRAEPTFYFLHSMLPHATWRYLPDGRIYTLYEPLGVRGVLRPNGGKGISLWLDDWLAVQAYQRHLLQVGFVDTLLGELLAHLEEKGIYDEILLVVAADHGSSFVPTTSRRKVTEANHPDIMLVPLFVKAPGQSCGVRVEENVETVDLLPTLLGLLDIPQPWPMDGRNVLGDSAERPLKTIFPGKGAKLTFSSPLSSAAALLRRKVDWFGTGSFESAFRIGPWPELLGRKVAQLRRRDTTGPRISFEGRELLLDANPESGFLLTHIFGHIEWEDPPSVPVPLAVAVNGVIRALTQTSPQLDANAAFSAVMPWWVLERGRNQVETFLIDRVGGEFWLSRSAASFEEYGLDCSAPRNCRILVDGQDSLEITPDHLIGWVVGGQGEGRDHYWVGGWAADQENRKLAKVVIVFRDDQLVARGRTRFERSHAAQRLDAPHLRRSGFRLEVVLPSGRDPALSRIRVFAISEDRKASELHYPRDPAKWPFQPNQP